MVAVHKRLFASLPSRFLSGPRPCSAAAGAVLAVWPFDWMPAFSDYRLLVVRAAERAGVLS